MITVSAHLKLFTLEAKGVKDDIEIEMSEGSKVLDLLEELSFLFPEILIIDKKRKISNVLCVVNNKAALLNDTLKDGDKIFVLHLFDGG